MTPLTRATAQWAPRRRSKLRRGWTPDMAESTDTAGGLTSAHAPVVVTVGVTVLRDLRRALDGNATLEQIARLRLDLDDLIATAEESAWSL